MKTRYLMVPAYIVRIFYHMIVLYPEEASGNGDSVEFRRSTMDYIYTVTRPL